MNWIKKYKLPTTKTIQFNENLYIELKDFWQAFHQTFNSAQDQHINLCLLNEVLSKLLSKQLSFSKVKFTNTIKKCSSLSIPGPDHILQSYLKILMTNNKCIMATTSQNNQQTTKANSKIKYLIGITRELNKEFPMYFYTIYTIHRQFMLTINILL